MAVVLLALVGTIWAGYVASRLRGRGRLGTFASLATTAIALQAVFGIVLAIVGARPQDGLHFVFGPLTLLALPGARWLAAGRGTGARLTSPRAQAVAVTTGWALTLALGLRAVGTGGGVG